MENMSLWEKRIENKQLIAPNFDATEGVLPQEYWNDWMDRLVDENSTRVLNNEDDFLNYASTELVEYVFTVCARMYLPEEIRFLAVLYFDSFMRKTCRNAYKFVDTTNSDIYKKDREWEMIEGNMQSQIPLRVLCCIQLATKEFQYYSSLSTVDIVNTLRGFDYFYTQNAVRLSELRIVRTLNFNMPKSPIVYPESILKHLSRYSIEELAIEKELNMSSLWKHIVAYMDMFFLYHEKYANDIVSKKYANDVVNNENQDANDVANKENQNSNDVANKLKQKLIPKYIFRKQVLAIKRNYSLLGCATVLAAIHTVHDSKVVESLFTVVINTLPDLDEEDVANACFALFDIVNGEE